MVFGLLVSVVDVVIVVVEVDVFVMVMCLVVLLFDGGWVCFGVFVVVVGFSMKLVCEFDDILFGCVVFVVVEWYEVVC